MEDIAGGVYLRCGKKKEMGDTLEGCECRSTGVGLGKGFRQTTHGTKEQSKNKAVKFEVVRW